MLKWPSSAATASEEARRTLRYVEPLSDARTKLADFFSILLGAETDQGRRCRSPTRRSSSASACLSRRPYRVSLHRIIHPPRDRHQEPRVGHLPRQSLSLTTGRDAHVLQLSHRNRSCLVTRKARGNAGLTIPCVRLPSGGALRTCVRLLSFHMRKGEHYLEPRFRSLIVPEKRGYGFKRGATTALRPPARHWHVCCGQ